MKGNTKKVLLKSDCRLKYNVKERKNCKVTEKWKNMLI